MNAKTRVTIGNALSKVLARTEHSGQSGSPIEAILRGDFFEDDYAKPNSQEEPPVPTAPRKRGRPRKHPVEGTSKDASLPKGVFRVGNTLKTRIQFEGRRVQVDLKTNIVKVALLRKTHIQDLIFTGKFYGTCPPISMANAWEQFKATQRGQVEDSTFSIYFHHIEKHVIPLLGNMPMHEMSNQRVALLLNNYQGIHPYKSGTKTIDTSHIESMVRMFGLAPAGAPPWTPNLNTRNKGGANLLLATLKTFFYWSIEYGLIEKMPFTKQKLPHKLGARPYVNYTLIRAFLDAVAKHTRQEDLVLACRVAIFLGLRSDEIRRSEWWWIDFDNSTFTPRDTKGKECEPVPVPPSLMKTLRQEFDQRGNPLEDLIFPRVQAGDHDKDESRSSATRTANHGMRKRGEKRPESELRPRSFLRSVVIRAGRQIFKHGLTPHRLRATFATLHAMSGTPIRDIQKMLRHKHITTTLGYIEDIPEIRQLAQVRMEKLAGFGEMGANEVQSLRSWSEDLAEYLKNGLPRDTPVDESSNPVDFRFALGEIIPLLERLATLAKSA